MATDESASKGTGTTETVATGTADATQQTETVTQTQTQDVVPKAEVEALRKKLNAEAASHRMEAKKAKEELERVKAALGINEGGETKAAPKPDASSALEARLRNTMLKSEFVAVASKHGVVDANDAFELSRAMLKDVTVDLDAETVDGDAIESAVSALKEKKPYLFTKANAGTSSQSKPTATPTKAPARVPDGGGAPASGGTAYTQWRALHDAGDKVGANNFFLKNKQGVLDTWPRGK